MKNKAVSVRMSFLIVVNYMVFTFYLIIYIYSLGQARGLTKRIEREFKNYS